MCRETGKIILDTIDPTIDPCENFYNFGCGGWMKATKIPKDRTFYSRMTEIEKKLEKIMKFEMNKESEPGDSVSVRYALDFYKACSDIDTIECRGLEPLIDLLNELNGWPLMGDNSDFDEKKYNWKDSIVKLYAKTGFNVLVQFEVAVNSKNTKENIIYFVVPEHELGRNQLVDLDDSPDVVKAYKKFILETAILLGANDYNQTNKDIEDLVAFESELAKISSKPEDMRESKAWYNRMTFKQLNALTANQVDWLSLTQSVFLALDVGIKLKSTENVIIKDIPYYKGLGKLLSKTPNRVIANHLGWIAANKLLAYTTEEFRQIEFEFDKYRDGIQEASPLEKRCLEALEFYLPFAYSRKYTDNHFTKSARKEVRLLTDYVQKSIRTALQDNDWLDNKTRHKSIQKLDAVLKNLAYPDWPSNNDVLDQFYNLTQVVDKEKALESLLYMQVMDARNALNKLRTPVNISLNWPTYPAKVNAFYESMQNSITFPAGILSPPYFMSEAPAYLNFGGIGMVIGHEFTHGFDDQGSEFDAQGNLNSWWTDSTKKIFKEKTKCFIDKFSQHFVPEVNMSLNGQNTVGEDISDAGGIAQAYNAYKIYSKKYGTPKRLPYVSEYTPDQMYFIAIANTYCAHYRLEALKDQIEYNPHSPPEYRVNVQLSNLKIFSETFQCKPNSTMNQGATCKLW